MKIIILLAVMTISLNSQWINNIGYSISKEKFENSEWRIYEGELQVHHNDSSYFYNIENLKLNDKLRVVSDTIFKVGIDVEHTYDQKLDISDNLFDKIFYHAKGPLLHIFDEKTLDTIKTIDMREFLVIRESGYSDIYLFNEYTISTINNKVIIFNNTNFAVFEYYFRGSLAYIFKPIIIEYNLLDGKVKKSKFIDGSNNGDFSLFQNNNSVNNPNFIFYEIRRTANDGSLKIINKKILNYDILKDTIINSIKLDNIYINDKFINKSFEYLTTYNNYTFNSREIKNWGNQTIDTNIKKYKARLIQEIIPNTYLMYSDSINYFIYNLIDNNLVVLDKINDIHKKEQFRIEYIDEEKNLFYAETASHKIARVSISSIVNNLISVDFSVDKNMADSNYVFTFENKSVGDIDEYLWEFGDGNTSTEKTPKYKYDSSGTYDITLTCSGAGQTTSNIKKGHIYIPTPVRIHVSHTMTVNENDASFYVSSGATGSRLKYRLLTNPYYDIRYTDYGSPTDTLEASAYSFTTNKSYFTRYFLFEAWNEMYYAHQYYNITDIEFDFWNKDVVEEKIIENKNSKINLNSEIKNNFLLHNGNNEPITVIEDNGYIHIDNMIDENKYYEINKELELYSDYSFITKDNILYLLNIENNKNRLDSVDLNLIIGDDEIELYDNLDELNYALISKTSIYIIDIYGNLINQFNRPEEEPVFLKKINNEYYYGDKYYNKNDPSLHTVFRIIIFDDKFERKYAVRSLQNIYTSKVLKTFLYKEGNFIKMNRFENLKSGFNLYSYSIDLANGNNVTSKTYNNLYKPYFYIYNNKYVSLIQANNLDLLITDLNSSNNIYNYTFNERMGSMNSALFTNNYLYLFGLNYKGSNNGYKKVLWKLDLKEEMYLNVEENVIEENKKYLWDYELILNNKYNNLSEINLIDFMGNMVDKSNYSLQFQNDKLIIKAINLSNGVYNLRLNNENIILLKY